METSTIIFIIFAIIILILIILAGVYSYNNPDVSITSLITTTSPIDSGSSNTIPIDNSGSNPTDLNPIGGTTTTPTLPNGSSMTLPNGPSMTLPNGTTPVPTLYSLPKSPVDSNLLFIGDIIGGDIIGQDKLNYISVSNIDNCYYECSRTSNCIAFVYQPFLNNGKMDSLNPPSVSNATSQKCWLKTSNGIVNIADSTKVWYSGNADNTRNNIYSNVHALPYQETISFDTSFLLPSTKDYINGDLNILSNVEVSNCFSSCKENSNCLTFKYNDQYKTCYLKDGTGQYINSPYKTKMYTGPIDYSHAPFISNNLTTDNTNYSILRTGKIYNKKSGAIPIIKNGKINAKVKSINDCSDYCKKDINCETYMYDKNTETCYLLQDINKNLTKTLDKLQQEALQKQIINDSTQNNFVWDSSDKKYGVLNFKNDNFYKKLSPSKTFAYNDVLFTKGEIFGGDIGKNVKVNNDLECYNNCLYTKDCYTFVYDPNDKTCSLKNANGIKHDGTKKIYTGLINDASKPNKYK